MIRIGVSGWSYDHWRGAFYPEGLPRRRELAYASRRLDAIEVNGSFYSLISPKTWERYREAAPEGFLFAVKGNRFITHSKKLRDVRTPLANFLAQGLLRLEEKLGPIVWQLPEQRWGVDRLEAFLAMLPRDTEEASRLAKRHDSRLSGRASMAVERSRPMRHALEIRHGDFFSADVVRACRKHGVAIVFADSGDWPWTEEITAGFCYLRLHGSPDTYASNYGEARLGTFADRIRAWHGGGEPPEPVRITDRKPPRRKTRDVYVFFDNDGAAHAPANALALMERLGVEARGEWPEDQSSS